MAIDTHTVNTLADDSHIRLRLLQFLSILALLTVVYLAKLILLPVMVAAFISLFASPAVRAFGLAHIPRAVASVIVVASLTLGIGYIFSLLLEPAVRWIEAVPVLGDRLAFELERAEVPLASTAVTDSGTMDSAMQSTVATAASALAESSLILIAQISAIIILCYFFLAYGEALMRNIVKAQEQFSHKKRTVVMFQSVRDDISIYILVVSLINIGLGLSTAAVLTFIDFEDALLWGALATLLNFAPYIGPSLLAVILTFVGFVSGAPLEQVFLAPGLFLVLNIVESQFVTPTVLGKRFNINPLLVVLWMFLWGWLWGAAGMLLAIPMLMCFKLISVHLDLIGPWVEVFNGDNRNVDQSKKHTVFEKLTKRLNASTQCSP